MTGLSQISAIILAGGLGTRLRAVVADRPKALAMVAGRPFLAHLLERIEAVGIRRVTLCTGHMGQQVRSAFHNRWGAMALSYSQEQMPLGTGGALALAMSKSQGERFLVMNGDSYCHGDLRAFAAAHEAHRAAGSLLLAEVPDGSRYGQVHSAPDGHIRRFEEKGAAGGSGWINAGIYLLERRVVEGVSRGAAVSLEREIFPRWIGRGLYGHPATGPFIDIGTPASYAQAEQFFSSQKAA